MSLRFPRPDRCYVVVEDEHSRQWMAETLTIKDAVREAQKIAPQYRGLDPRVRIIAFPGLPGVEEVAIEPRA